MATEKQIKQLVKFESNQSGIETPCPFYFSGWYKLFESNQSGIETHLCIVFESPPIRLNRTRVELKLGGCYLRYHT